MPSLDLEADDTELMEIWHDQTRFYRASMNRRSRIMHRFMTDPNMTRRAVEGWPLMAGEKIISLPRTEAPSVSLSEALARRISTPRHALSAEMTFEQLASLLHLAAFASRQNRSAHTPDATFYFRPYPSAGGLYPCELFVIPGAVAGLDRRPYRYDARRHTLINIEAPDGRFAAVEFDPALEPPACALVIAAVLDRTTRKYGPRGYRMACIEAGHMGQNLVLAAAALGLNSLVYSAFCDNELEAWLGLDGMNEVALSVVLIGGQTTQSLSEGT